MANKINKKTHKAPKRYRSTFMHNGKRYEATSTVDQKDADKRAAIKEDQLKRGEIGLSGNMSVKRWAYEWLETYKKPAVTTKSYKDYKAQIDKFIVPSIGSERLIDVKDIQLQKILNTRAGFSTTRAKILKNTICGIFDKARKSRLILYNPAEDLELPKTYSGTNRSITDYEREHFLKVAETHHAGLMFKMMLYCGLRTGEVTALSWSDVNLDTKLLNIANAMESGTEIIGDPKTTAGVRDIPIPEAIYKELLIKSKNTGPSDPVFTQPTTGRRHTESSRQKAWKSFKKQMDISMGAVFEKRKAKDGKMRMTQVTSVVADDLVPYGFRHTYCTDLQEKGVPINVAKYLMGHSCIKVTARIYTHITPKAIKDAALRIDDNSKITA